MASAVPSAVSGAEPAPGSVRAISLRILVEDHDVSVRLRNCITAAAATGTLSLPTVGAYIDAGPHAEAMMLREVRNLGRKTARELGALVWAVATQAPAEENVGVAPAPDERDHFLALLADETIGSLAAEEILSARLTAILALPHFAEKSLADVLANFVLTSAEMLRVPNCGRKSVSEFRDFCHRNAVRRLHMAGYENGDAILATLISGRSVVSSAPSIPAAERGVDLRDAPDHGSLVDRIEWLLSDLPERTQVILRRRNGVGQPTCETLEEIGIDFAVTRERIRQVEAKALKRLAIKTRRAPLRGFILDEAGLHWDELTGNDIRLRDRDLHEAKRRLNPYLRLACDIEGLSVEAWLNLIAHQFPCGWLSPREDRAAIDDAIVQLGDLSQLPIPYPLSGLVAPELLEMTASAVELCTSANYRFGYLMPPRVGMRATRLVRLHALLASSGTIVPLERLLDRYRGLFSDDPCGERDAEIVMDAAPHLLLEVEEGSWVAINQPGFLVEAGDAPPTPRARTEEPGTIAYALQETLRARGPTRLGELLDEAADILPDGRSANSIGPVLLTRRELFTRALPGVYALHDQIAPLRERLPENWPVLFNDVQARQYALSRYAGEAREIFPLWSASAEYELCRWARHSGGPGILNSLLAIAVIDDWPVTSAEREEWRRLQAQQGRYEIGSALRYGSAYDLPDFDRVFAACRYVAANGAFNYCAANRLTGRKLDSHGGAGLLALLLRLGVLEEETSDGYRWQRSHRATGRAAVLVTQFEEAFAGALETPDWSSALGKMLAAEIRNEWASDSWVDAGALAGMFDATVSTTFDDEDDDPLAQLLAEQRRVRDIERREATLDWLLTQ